jgi:transcriptional regulator with XRE-family HTH domain
VDRVKVGNTFRAIRVELRLRQVDVAARAGLSQATVSMIERGKFGAITLDKLDRVAATLEAEMSLTLRWRGPKLARLLDRRHARLQNAVVARLSAGGWQILPEETFNEYGDRGSVDILAWLPAHRALLIVEIKTEIVDLQDMLHSLNVKRRVVPRLASGAVGGRPESVGAVVVLPDHSTQRRAVADHAALFTAALPARTREVSQWLARPDGALRGIWFFPSISGVSGMEELSTRRRVRLTRHKPSRPRPRPETPIQDANRALAASIGRRTGDFVANPHT